MAAPVLRARGLSKRFDIYASPWQRVVEWAARGRPTLHRELWAVDDVTFDIQPGEVLGVIGVNGAGKSTLVKMLTGVLDPTRGSVETHGRVLSLPELGSDLNEALTGQQNVEVSSQLLGLPDDFVRARMNDIVEFSELGEFFHYPVATYSTGMRMRLAFSMFTFLDCELLIVDEVMAVGDVFFQQKCYERISQLVASGTAILLVTHDLNALQHYCDRVIVLHHGRVRFEGDATSAIQTFVQLRGTRTAPPVETTSSGLANGHLAHVDHTLFDWPADSLTPQPIGGMLRGGHRGRLTTLAVCDAQQRETHVFMQGETAIFYYEFQVEKDIGVPVGIIEINNAYNILIHSKNSLQHQLEAPPELRTGDRVRFSQRIELGLQPGDYVFNVGLLTMHPDDYARAGELSQQELNERLVWVCRQVRAGALVVTFGFGHGRALTHAGLCDLPGACQAQRVPAVQPAPQHT